MVTPLRVRNTLFALATILLALSAACGDNSKEESEAATPTIPTTFAETDPMTPSPIAGPCPKTSPRDSAGRFLVSLADPVCVDLRGLSAASVQLKVRDDLRSVLDIRSGETRYVVPSVDSPYGPTGCLHDKGFWLQVTVLLQGQQKPVGSAFVACSSNQDATGCGTPGDAPGGLQTSSGEGNDCLFWTDRSVGESGFRVEITYYNLDQVFSYLLPPNNNVFQVPAEAAPRLTESRERCLERKDVTLSVVAVFAGKQDEPVGERSIVAECRR